MNTDYGFVQSVEIGNDLEDDNDKYIATCTFSDEQDERKIQIINLSGINVRPRKGHKLLVINLGGGFELGICSDDNIKSDLEDGETEIYSIDSDNKKSAKIKLKTDGSVYINDGTDYSVQYTSLKNEFNSLQKSFDDFINIYNAHSHATAPIGPVSPPSSPGTASTADITKCKVDSVRIP